MIWVADASNATVYLDAGWEQLTGQAVGDALGTGWVRAIHAEDRPIVEQMIRNAWASQVAYCLTYRVIKPKQAPCWVQDIATPVLRPCDGEFLGYMGSLHVTDGASYLCAQGQIIDPCSACNRDGVAAEDAIEQIADLVMSARSLAKGASEDAVRQILDLALLEIGFRLAETGDGPRSSSRPGLNS